MTGTVLSYSIEQFAALLKEHSEASDELIGQKLRAKYFEDYFSSLNVQTIVVEHPYIDHDYLNDFSAYYVKCFHPYRRQCTRLHFFSETFSEETFRDALQAPEGQTAARVAKQYRGFVVVRPLPQSVIGRTALAHYESDVGRRKFPTAVRCRANLFGLELSVKAVPFQEQDQVTSACATSALWSALHVTAQTFQHSPLSPVDITRWATDRMPLKQRVFPNAEGLTIEQMAHAIRSVGLEPFYVDASTPEAAKAAIYAYVTAGIPALLMFAVEGERNGTRVAIGHHAVTITGYSLPQSGVGQFGHTEVKSAGIDKIYVHDDQVGPNARMEFIVPRPEDAHWEMTTSWGLGGEYSNIRATPQALLFPLYNKIRLSFRQPHNDILRLDGALHVLAAKFSRVPVLTWDLRLTTLRDLRRDMASWPLGSSDERERLLKKSLPRFLWQATGSSGDVACIEIIFDATDIDSGKYIRLLQILDPALETAFIAASRETSKLGHRIRRLQHKIDETGP